MPVSERHVCKTASHLPLSLARTYYVLLTGKYVPTLSYKIHTENQDSPAVPINLRGLAVGNGGMSPPDSFIYGDYLFELGLVDDIARGDLLEMERELKDLAAREQYEDAWAVRAAVLQRRSTYYPCIAIQRYGPMS